MGKKKNQQKNYISHKALCYRKEDPRTGSIPFEKFIKHIKEAPSNEATWIKGLVSIYVSYIQKAQNNALKELDTYIAGDLDKKMISIKAAINELAPRCGIPGRVCTLPSSVANALLETLEPYKTLTMAKLGDIKAAQYLVQEDPEAIYLPFIQKTLLKILRDHRNIIPSKDESLIDIKLQWEGFLTKRSRGKIPFSPKDLGRAVKFKEKEIKADMPHAIGIREDALEETAKSLKIGKESLKKKARFGK